MQYPDLSKITIDKLQLPLLKEKEVEMDMMRLDKIHPVISGNKWFKLKYHLENFMAGNYEGILSFGGAWSNHIAAMAAICFLHKIKCAGIIRGEKPARLSQTLQDAIAYGMQSEFIPRTLYRNKEEAGFIDSILEKYPGYYLIPEGGAGADGEKGAGEILNLVNKDAYTHIACCIGTGAMFNGIINNAATGQQVVGITVLKGIKETVSASSGKILNSYHFGGYAKYTPELLHFINDFYRQTGIPSDFVYTGKLAFAVTDLSKKDFFPPGSRVLVIHSGGLQGNASLSQGTLIF
jgi:1-aminocyclopropane-1-carboxylate deaminase